MRFSRSRTSRPLWQAEGWVWLFNQALTAQQSPGFRVWRNLWKPGSGWAASARALESWYGPYILIIFLFSSPVRVQAIDASKGTRLKHGSSFCLNTWPGNLRGAYVRDYPFESTRRHQHIGRSYMDSLLPLWESRDTKEIRVDVTSVKASVDWCGLYLLSVFA